MKITDLIEERKDVRVSNIRSGNAMFADLEKLAGPEIKKHAGKAEVNNVAKKYKGASFAIVTYKDPSRYYFRMDKQDLKEGTELSDKQKQELLADFKEWSGDYTPDEMPWKTDDDEQSVSMFIDSAINSDLPKEAAVAFLKSLM